ncbi:hypothetical protein PF003_g28043 [Phytophthora fragariae]|nr:hypothetical protein PF003_g28043 [Phytophthora fragariae]
MNNEWAYLQLLRARRGHLEMLVRRWGCLILLGVAPEGLIVLI